MATTYTRRSISLPEEVNERLGSEENASALVARLLTNEFARQDRLHAVGDDVHSFEAEGRIYRFKGRYLDEDANWGIWFYLHKDGSMVVTTPETDKAPEVVPVDEVEDWFGENTIPDAVAEAFNLSTVVWL